MISSATTPERLQFRRDEKLAANASAHLDMMRGVAAFAVLFGHGRNIILLAKIVGKGRLTEPK